MLKIVPKDKQSEMLEKVKKITVEIEPMSTIIIVFKHGVFEVAFCMLLKLLI
jgi:hypothetical protein